MGNWVALDAPPLVCLGGFMRLACSAAGCQGLGFRLTLSR